MKMFLLILLTSFGSSASAQAPAYLLLVISASDFQQITLPDDTRPDSLRVTKYTTPQGDDPGLLPTVYQNVNLYPLHPEFLAQVFPEKFAGLTIPEYLALIQRRATRRYFAGGIYSFQSLDGGTVYGFDVYTDPADPDELLTEEETRLLYEQLSQTFLLQPFTYSPTTAAAMARAHSWSEPGFPIYFPGDVAPSAYKPYTTGTAYGRVRILSLAELERSWNNGRLSWQDILVLDGVPTDIESVVSAIITGAPQGELSHVAIRAARRGSPNAYVQNATAEFSSVEGQLIRLDVGNDGYTIQTGIDPAEAQAWWDAHRPLLPNVLVPDFTYAGMDALTAMDVKGASRLLTSRFGGKAANLARAYTILPSIYQAPGFAIPFKYYREFMRSNVITDNRQSPPVVHTYENYLLSLKEDPEFQSNSAYRYAKLEEFQEYAEDNGQIDPILVSDLVTRIIAVFGSANIMVRFRSSSNIEDALEFNGAGLYDSVSVCAADNLDADSDGPCACDPAVDNERTIERGLIRVWMSLWNYKAWEERAFFQIPQERAAMAILVTPAYGDEASNGVLFTGDPMVGRSAGYVINAQIGDNSVVLPDRNVLPEKDLIRMASGEISLLRRIHPSSLMPPGEWVLNATQLQDLGSAAAILDAGFDFNTADYPRDSILLDMEFKFDQSGALVIKQVRPFLLSTIGPPQPNQFYSLNVPPGTTLCGVWREGRTIREEYDIKAQIDLIPGTVSLSKTSLDFEADLIQQIRFSPSQTIAVPLARGRFTQQINNPYHTYQFKQSFLVDKIPLAIVMDYLTYSDADPVKTLDEPYITNRMFMTGEADLGGPWPEYLRFTSCTYSLLPLWHVNVELEGRSQVLLHVRWQPPMAGSGPANLVYGEANLPEGKVNQSNYWKLTYCAEHHNWNEKFWLLFDNPLGDIHGIGIYENLWPLEYHAAYLDKDLNSLRDIKVISYKKSQVFQTPTPTPTITPTQTPTIPPAVAANDVIFNEYWLNDDGTPYESLNNRTINGDWVELLVAKPGGVDLRGWRVTNNPSKVTNLAGDSSGSLIFPNRPEFSHVPGGTVILLIADIDPDNSLNFPDDDLNAGDGNMILYVGNGILDASSDPEFTIRTGDDALVLLHPGSGAGYADDVGVDFIAEGNLVTPGSFGVAGDGVFWPNPFNGIGADDGAIFVNSYGGGLNNDDGDDPNRLDDQHGPGGWIVDPPRQFSGDDPTNPLAINILTPGRLNRNQSLPFDSPTPTPTLSPTPTPTLIATPSPTATQVPGIVNWHDLFGLSSVWEETGYTGEWDLNGDTVVDELDIFKIYGSWH